MDIISIIIIGVVIFLLIILVLIYFMFLKTKKPVESNKTETDTNSKTNPKNQETLSKTEKAEDMANIAQNNDVHSPHKILNKLINYIDACLDKGYSTEEIYKHLKSVGWTEDQINEGFKRFEILNTYHDMKKKELADKEIEEILLKKYTPDQIREAMMHHTAVLGKDATNQDKTNHLGELAQTHKVANVSTKMSQLQKYIRECYKFGYNKEIIKKTLISKGWEADTVERAFGLI